MTQPVIQVQLMPDGQIFVGLSKPLASLEQKLFFLGLLEAGKSVLGSMEVAASPIVLAKGPMHGN